MKVTVEIMGDEMQFLLGSREISSGDLDVYSEKSPLGSAVMGAKVGDEKSYTAPNGKTIAVKVLKAEIYS
jgi:transcription elongation factor GreA